jgi:hypothetical protein|tara:strand:+ start:166 stop:522 length:357 start_codon:yes stop_codon:yes gene_type:complete
MAEVMATPAHKKDKEKNKVKPPLGGYSNSTPQGRADKKKEADRKAKIKKMDNASKEKPAKFVNKDKDKKKVKPKAPLSKTPSSTPQGRANKEKLRKAKIANFNVESEAKLISKKSKKK